MTETQKACLIAEADAATERDRLRGSRTCAWWQLLKKVRQICDSREEYRAVEY